VFISAKKAAHRVVLKPPDRVRCAATLRKLRATAMPVKRQLKMPPGKAAAIMANNVFMRTEPKSF
jgi:hypothetical protein